MVNSISPRSAGGPTTDDPSWLVADHGQNLNLSATFDVSLFVEEDHFPDGFLKSGIPVGKVTATGLYGPYDDSEDDGRQVCVGFLYSPLTVVDGLGSPETVFGAIYTHGGVVEANLPVEIDANGKADVAAHIQFR